MAEFKEMEFKLVIGLSCQWTENFNDVMLCKEINGCDFVAIPLVDPNDNLNSMANSSCCGSDFRTSSNKWMNNIVFQVPNSLDFEEANLTDCSRLDYLLRSQIGWASYLSTLVVVLPPFCLKSLNYARSICCLLQVNDSCRYWVHVKTSWDPSANVSSTVSDEDEWWRGWNLIRTLCNSNSRLSVALELSLELPSDLCMRRWLGEPVKAIILDVNLFSFEEDGSVSLPFCHLAFLSRIMKSKPHLIISDSNDLMSSSIKMGPYKRYSDYLRHFFACFDIGDEESNSFRDCLQFPLQPLSDNLESQTYEVFEQDPSKYRCYENAIFQALVSYSKSNEQSSTAVVMVIGAGRGPLVSRVLSASGKSKVNVRVYAIEKNEFAVIMLRKRQSMDASWRDVVIIASDVRSWRPIELADILVSELLGSFGCNELSPECLYVAEDLMKQPGGVCIPCQYTSFLRPISSVKVWTEVRKLTTPSPFDKPYVVKLFNYFPMADEQQIFSFCHPRINGCDKCNQFSEAEFICDETAVLHGFEGCFMTHLFGDVFISSSSSCSPEVVTASWFPLYFPIQTPMVVNKDQSIRVCMWRRRNREKVWYEWAVVEPIVTPIHNSGGNAYAMKLFIDCL